MATINEIKSLKRWASIVTEDHEFDPDIERDIARGAFKQWTAPKNNSAKYAILSEEDQIALVKRDGRLIFRLYRAGIKPSEAVQLAAVKDDGRAIQYITDANIKPSEAVQLAAVRQDPDALRYINNPSLRIITAAKVAKVNPMKLLKRW